MTREELERLKEKTDAYIGEVFDAVSSLGQVSLLQHLYDFNIAVEKRLEETSV